MKTLTITSSFATLSEAVAASKIDLSYNATEAHRTIKSTDSGYGGKDMGVTRAFLMEDGSVKYIYSTGGMNMLHTFNPFISCLNDSPLQVATVNEAETEITLHDAFLPKSDVGRGFFKKNPKALAA